MRLFLTDRRGYEAASAPGGMGERETGLTTHQMEGHTAGRWDRRYAVVDRVEGLLLTVSSRSYEWIGSGWMRLLDQQELPRRWWWPAATAVPLSHDDLQRQHAQCSETTNRLLFTLIGFCFFCLLTLGGSDAALLAASAQVAVPVVNISLSNIAFLKVGPLILIALLLYLHILVERLLRYDALDVDQRLPHIFNMGDPVSRLLSWFLFYWMVPLVLALFTWKAGPRPEAPLIGSMATLVTALLLWLQMRRCPQARRRCNIPLGVALVALLALFPFMASGRIPLNRSLNLYEAALARMDLSSFDLRGANLSRANLQGTFLSKADLQGANLQSADFTNAILEEANLNKAQLSWAQGLSEANLRKVAFEGANLSETNLYKADLRGAILHGTALYQTNLRGADLEGVVGLTKAQIAWAITDETTRLPRYLRGPSEQR